jgi:hypothetical protein
MSVARKIAAFVFATSAMLAVPQAVDAQARIQCESRDYSYQFCAFPARFAPDRDNVDPGTGDCGDEGRCGAARRRAC